MKGANDSENVAANTDRELWRKGDGDGDGMSHYEPSIHVTQRGLIGINVGGTVFELPVEEWHSLAFTITKPQPRKGPGVFEKIDAVKERLAVRSILDPAHADWMRTRLQAVLATIQDAQVTYGIINEDKPDIDMVVTPMMVERDAIVEALYGDR